MPSLGALKLFCNLIKTGHRLGCFPLQVNSKKSPAVLSVSKSHFKRYLFHFWSIQTFCFLLYLIIQLNISINSCDKEYSEIIWLLIWITAYIWGFGYGIVVWTFRYETSACFNETRLLQRSLCKDNVIHVKRFLSLDLIYSLLFLHQYIGIGILIAVIGLHTLRPDFKQFLTSILYKEQELIDPMKLTALFGISLLDVLSQTVLISTTMNSSAILFWYVIFLSESIHGLRKSKLSPTRKLMYYIQFQILSNVHSSATAWVVPIFIYSIWTLIIIGSVGLIRFHYIVTHFEMYILLNFTIFCPVVFIGMLHVFGSIPDECDKLLKSLKKSLRSNKYYNLRLKSLKPLGIRNGLVKLMRYAAVCTTFTKIANTIVKILIKVPKQNVKGTC